MWVEVLCWIDRAWASKECACCVCDSNVHLSVPSIGFVYVWVCEKCCRCVPTPMNLASMGSPMFPLVVHQSASPSIWPAVQTLRRGLSTNPGVTM